MPGTRAAEAGAEQGARLHRAGGIGVNGIWLLEICSLILAGTGRRFGKHLPFPQHKYNFFVYNGKKNPNPQLGGLSFTWVKTRQFHPKLPVTEPPVAVQGMESSFWLPWPWSYSHLDTRATPSCLHAHHHYAGAGGISRLLLPDSRRFPLPRQDERCCSLGTCCWEQSPAPLPLPGH